MNGLNGHTFARLLDLFPALQAGDLVDFRLIQPVAVGIDRVAMPAAKAGASTSPPSLSAAAGRRTSLKAELLEAFELSQVQGTLLQFKPDQQVMELKSPYGHSLLVTMGGGLNTAAVIQGDEVIVDILDGLVVDLHKSSANSLSFKREDVILSEDFGGAAAVVPLIPFRILLAGVLPSSTSCWAPSGANEPFRSLCFSSRFSCRRRLSSFFARAACKCP